LGVSKVRKLIVFWPDEVFGSLTLHAPVAAATTRAPPAVSNPRLESVVMRGALR
jgi:hypothetical protein